MRYIDIATWLGHTSGGGVLALSRWLAPRWVVVGSRCWESCPAASPHMSIGAFASRLCALSAHASGRVPSTHFHTWVLVGQLSCRSCPSVVAASSCHTAHLSILATWASHMPSLPWYPHQCCHLPQALSQGTWNSILWWLGCHQGGWCCGHQCQVQWPCTLSSRCWSLGRGVGGNLSTSAASPVGQPGLWSTTLHRQHIALSMGLAPKLFTAGGKILAIFHRRRRNFDQFFIAGDIIMTGRLVGGPTRSLLGGGPWCKNASFASPKSRPWLLFLCEQL